MDQGVLIGTRVPNRTNSLNHDLRRIRSEACHGLFNESVQGHGAWIITFVDQIGVYPRRSDLLHSDGCVTQGTISVLPPSIAQRWSGMARLS